MNRPEAIKLLALIKVAYPASYRDMDEESLNATVTMWAHTFPSTPYVIMEMAFERHRRKSKFPPTVAEMIEELKTIHFKATGDALTYASVGGNSKLIEKCRWVADHTSVFARDYSGELWYDTVTDNMLMGGDRKRIGGGIDG